MTPGFLRMLLLLMLLTPAAACGYHVQSAVRDVPGGVSSLGVPVFRNLTPQFRIEQRITQSVLRELAARTRVPVEPRGDGVDAVLEGEIRSISASPVSFGRETFASAFLVTVQMSVRLVRSRDKSVLWENGDFSFRERYEINPNVVGFFSEENPALERLARDFAASLTST